jgi:ketosteroid isomerase-like protein
MNDRLSALLERELIREVLENYCMRLDEGDIDGVVACFSDDAVADYGPGRGGLISGAKTIGARIAGGQAAFCRTHHQLGQIRIELNGATAQALSYVTAWHERFGGEREIACLRYVDTLTYGTGRWLIARRHVEASYIDGFPGTAWDWVSRKSRGV